MELVTLIVTLALIQYLYFGALTGMARRKYGVKAPAIAGHPLFERQFRIQQNTLEQIVVFVPACVAFAWQAEALGWAGNEIAAACGVVWLIGRGLYARAYLRDPLARGAGFLLSLAPSAVLLGGTLVAVVVSITQG